MISTLIAILPLLALMVYSILLFAQVNVKQRVEWSLREYMLSMEVDGYLTNTNKSLLINKLSDLGVTEISFEDTTIYKVNYGESIVLHVKGQVKVPIMTNVGEWLLKTNEGYHDFAFKFQSTFLGK